MTIGHLLCLVAGFLLGALWMGRAWIREGSQPVVLDPALTRVLVTVAVRDALDEREDEDEAERYRDGDDWKRGTQD